MLVDSDVIIRYLTNDDSSKAIRFEKFLRSGKKVLLTDVSFAEIYWTLSSFYQFPKNQILAVLEALLENRSIISNKKILNHVLDILKRYSLSFIDAYSISYSLEKKDGKILSFDKGFDKIKTIHRFEP